MAILVDEGKMAWDDPVRKHLSYFHLSDPLADKDVRLRDLVCHRTGLAANDLLWYRAPWSMEEMVRRAGRLPLDQPFRTRFQYQSTMFTAAGLAVASAADQPWQDFVQKRLFDPLGHDGNPASPRRPPRRSPTGPSAIASTASAGRKSSIIIRCRSPNPAGSIHSTARDLSKWLIFQLGDGRVGGKRIVSAANLARDAHAANGHSP